MGMAPEPGLPSYGRRCTSSLRGVAGGVSRVGRQGVAVTCAMLRSSAAQGGRTGKLVSGVAVSHRGARERLVSSVPSLSRALYEYVSGLGS